MTDLIERVRKWLGPKGIKFFKDIQQEDGTLLNHWMEGAPSVRQGGVPHIVHFREGMQVRNFLRGQPECKDWTDHDFDNRWKQIIIRAIEGD